MRYILFVALFCQITLQASRGIVIAACDRYVDDLIVSLSYLRGYIGCQLPIEIWHAGDELSNVNQKRLAEIHDLKIFDITEKVNLPANHFRGFQIKGYLGIVTNFDEFIIMDADLIFYQDPESLFTHPEYKKNGAFFFSDQQSYRFYGYPRVRGRLYHGGLLSYYEKRKDFITSKIASPSPHFPKKWQFYWGEAVPTPLNPFPSEHLESGCVVIDRTRHQLGLEKIRQLNEDYLNTYQYVWGDKETFWMGMEMANEPYYINEAIPGKITEQIFKWLPFEKAVIRLVQQVDGKIFYQQKTAKFLSFKANFIQRDAGHQKRALDEEEVINFNLAFFKMSNGSINY